MGSKRKYVDGCRENIFGLKNAPYHGRRLEGAMAFSFNGFCSQDLISRNAKLDKPIRGHCGITIPLRVPTVIGQASRRHYKFVTALPEFVARGVNPVNPDPTLHYKYFCGKMFRLREEALALNNPKGNERRKEDEKKCPAKESRAPNRPAAY